jgi:hypothetical protein
MKALKSLAILALVIPTFLVADEDVAHIAVGSEPMSEEAKAQIDVEKAKLEEEAASLEVAGFVFDRYPTVYYSSSHHSLVAVTVLDNNKYTLEFEDGSVWKINDYDGTKALNWRSNDPLSITQNHRWFSNYTYRIINKSNGSAVEANLYLGPIEGGEHTRYIVAIDYDRKEIVLSDNTHHRISYLDTSILKDWKLSHAVILGMNSGWDSDCDQILINVNLNNCARSKQF